MVNRYSVRNGITKMPMTNKCYSTYAQAERVAVRLSKERTFTIEVWYDGELVFWYFKGERNI